MDPLLVDFFDHLRAKHREARYKSDMFAVADSLGVRVSYGSRSITVENGIQLNAYQGPRKLQEDAAHELAHHLADQGEYTEAIRYQHANVPDIDAHLEALMDHGALQLLLPDHLVGEIREEYGDTAEAIYRLARDASVGLELAAARMVLLDFTQRRVAFLLKDNRIQFARSTFWSPLWTGDEISKSDFLDAGGTLFEIPEARAYAVALFAHD